MPTETLIRSGMLSISRRILVADLTKAEHGSTGLKFRLNKMWLWINTYTYHVIHVHVCVEFFCFFFYVVFAPPPCQRQGVFGHAPHFVHLRHAGGCFGIPSHRQSLALRSISAADVSKVERQVSCLVCSDGFGPKETAV